MGAIVGIALGTTTTVGAARRDGKPAAIQDETGSSLIPSIVSFLPSGAVLVGDAARERRHDDPKNTVFSVKRLIGRPWDSVEVTQARQRFSFELKEGPGRATFVVARSETFTLPEISAYVLRKAKSIAELELGEAVDRAIITVPANFNDLQRAATKVAGRVAGLDVLRIINEPTAAALAYGYAHGNDEKIAVFDFGGGTFDITLLSLTENVFEVLATAGDTFLGGDDLDWAIAQKIAHAASTELGRDLRSDVVAIEHFRAAAEELKIRLSTSNYEEVHIDPSSFGQAAGRPLTFAMSQAELEQLAAPIVDRAFDVCREALRIARLDLAALDHVIAVGGCTKIPFVKRRAEQFFSRPLQANLDPHEVVAMGAALQGHALTTAEASARAAVPTAPLNQPATPPGEPGRRKTHPFERLGTTNIGMGQAPGADKFESIQVPGPEGAPSGPVPHTQNLASRGGMKTTMGIGSDPSNVDNLDWDAPQPEPTPPQDAFDPESLLPVVTRPVTARHSQGVFRAPEFAPDPPSLADPDDEEATMVRAPAALGPRGALPDLRDPLAENATAPADVASAAGVSARDTVADEAQMLPARTTRMTERARQVQPELPAVATIERLGSSTAHSARPAPASEGQRLSKPPTTDELRQRYGDLPLIIGGKRLSSSPTSKPAPELPLVRPTLVTIEHTTPLPPIAARAAAPTRARPHAPTLADPVEHPDLPLVGTRTRPIPEHAERTQNAAPPRRPAPPRAAPGPNRNQANTGARPVPSTTPIALSDSEFEEEARSQPPSTGRLSVRPGMRLEPGEEESLPLPDLPSQTPAAHTLVTAQVTPNRARIQLGDNAGAFHAGPTLGTLVGMGGGTFDDSLGHAASRLGAPTETPDEPKGAALAPPLVPAAAPAARPLRDAPAPSSPLAAYGGIAVPLLIDVTPLSLSVETVGTYCDVLIDRNTPVPCERTREFVTVQDGQQTVRVRVAQGESRVFAENLLLGELELTGLRPAPRGQLRISVTFGLDSDGLLHVRAIDLDTGRATTSELRLAGIPSPTEITQMANRQLPAS